MCGIAGRVVPAAAARDGDRALVAAMTRALAHRGPDDHGLVSRGGCTLGHRRLSIVDLAGGHQPLGNEDGSVWIVFNGEIYNHRELRSRLEARGHVFRTRSDTEAIVHAYEEDGLASVERLRGMFAFALWDGPRRRLVLARDRLGIKPLYYAEAGGRLDFASELRALLLDPAVDRAVDEDALGCYLGLRYVPAPSTILRGVKKLPPATLLVWEAGQARLHRYWDLASTPTQDALPPTEAEAAAELRERVDEAVEMRLMSEVPLGAFLSGGVDSTLVTAAMQARRDPGGERVRTFAVGYRDAPPESELSWAARAAHFLGTRHVEVELDEADAAAALPRIAWDLDEPIGDPASVPLWFLAQRTRPSVTVVLSGEGGDEVFAGYAIYRWMERMERLRVGGLGEAAALAERVLPSGMWPPPGFPDRWRRAARALGQPLETRYRGVSRALDDDARRRLLGDGAVRADRAMAAALAPAWDRTRGMTPLRRMLYLDTRFWLPDDLLMKADKMTMQASIELRVPLLDHRLVEYAWSLPDRFKLRRGEGKRILRRSARGRVPAAILDRPKQGFATPTASWLRRALAPLLDEVLLDRAPLAASRCDPAAVRALVDEHRRGRDRTAELWALLVLALWQARLPTVAPVDERARARSA